MTNRFEERPTALDRFIYRWGGGMFFAGLLICYVLWWIGIFPSPPADCVIYPTC